MTPRGGLAIIAGIAMLAVACGGPGATPLERGPALATPAATDEARPRPPAPAGADPQDVAAPAASPAQPQAARPSPPPAIEIATDAAADPAAVPADPASVTEAATDTATGTFTAAAPPPPVRAGADAAAAADPGSAETPIEQPPAAKQPKPAPTRIHIVGLNAESGQSQPIPGAHVDADGTALRAGADGVVTLDGPAQRYHVVAAGYWPARNVSPLDGVITLRPLDVRAIYLPYEQLWNPPSLQWALGLARQGLISAIVIDIKEEGGAVLPLVATEAVLAIDAVVDPGADMAAFLSELQELGIYRIARQLVFLDTRLGRSDLETAILTRGGSQLIDTLGLGWTTPFSATARRYNIDIAVKAAPFFEEIQFDYVRFPAGPLRVHEETTGPERSAAVARFAEEAVAALHAVGAAMSIDTFGETAVILKEDAIGQVLEELIPHIDYYSPMVYPSTYGPGWFDLPYPAADPETVVLLTVEAAVRRVAESGVVGVRVRPWLQDYRDYGPRQISYGFNEVLVQILASAESGGAGFMLWDPTLLYRTDVLALFAPEPGAG